MTGLRSAIALSGVAVLSYYALTNASVLALSPEQRRWPAGIAVLGLIGCLVLIVSLPVQSLLIGVALLLAGAAAGGRPDPEPA